MSGHWRRLGVAVAAVAATGLLTAAWRKSDSPMYGFADARAAAQREFERRFMALPSAARIRDAHRILTDQPHPAGSERDRELAEWTRDQFRRAGLANAEITTHEVLLPWPDEVTVEMTAPRAWRASMREEPIAADPHTLREHADPGIAYHAYSASGDVTAAVVFAGDGQPADNEWLRAHGIDERGEFVIVRYSVPYSYRGFKALTAQARGAAGILMFSAPENDGGARGATYPDGPWGPESRIERGGIAYDFLVAGDPLTPGWASVPGARRIAAREAVSLPTIVSAPLSFTDARVILDALDGPEVPAAWRGAGETRRAGAGRAIVRLKVRNDDRIRPVWTVTATIRGSENPDQVVIVGNHRDAWVYGGVDPGTGSAALIELARTLGELQRSGWRPRRSIVLASWDAEEFAMTTSTEWGEEHQDWLRKHAVAYLNVDSAASGPNLSVSAVPALNRLLDDVARTVKDPESRLPVGAVARDRLARDHGRRAAGTPEDVIDNRLGSGSDYTVFLNFLGVPVADISFEGPYGAYHSLYDTHAWVERIADPGFRYHAALVQFLGLTTMRLAGADVVPLDYEPYAQRLLEFAADVERQWIQRPGEGARELMTPVREAISALRAAAARFNDRRDVALRKGDARDFEGLNRQLLAVERELLDPDGLAGRPWYRHLVYAPKFTYAPEMLPGVAEAVDAGDARRAEHEAGRLAAALRRAARSLDDATK
jgi:N-acetylated-alpha-linked acidic dipeptidase